MDLRKQILTENECYKIGTSMTPKGVMWHSSGAKNTKLKRYIAPDDGKLGSNQYGNHWNQFRPDGRQVCVHGFIGEDKDSNVCTYQTLPFNMKGWHAGGSANNNYIGFEICEDDLTNADYFNKVYKEAVEFTAYLCKQYNLNPKTDGVIICHQDGYKRGIASNHSDIYHWFNKHGKTMDNVRSDVAVAMGQSASTTSASSSNVDTSKPSSNLKYGVGTVVCTNKIYTQSNGGKEYSGNWQGTITKVVADAQHPYLLDNGNIGWTTQSAIDSDPHYPSTSNAQSATTTSSTLHQMSDAEAKAGEAFWISEKATIYGGASYGVKIPSKILKATTKYSNGGTKYEHGCLWVLAKPIMSWVKVSECLAK